MEQFEHQKTTEVRKLSLYIGIENNISTIQRKASKKVCNKRPLTMFCSICRDEGMRAGVSEME